MRLRITAIIVSGIAISGGAASARASRLPISANLSLEQQTSSQTQGPQQDSVAEAARKSREKAKATTPAKKTYTNDSVAGLRGSQISVAGTEHEASKDATADATKPGATPEQVKDEKYWRKRFADARAKLALAERELDVSQRELNLSQTQYYADPNKQLQQQLTRDDINAKTAKVEEKKTEVAQLTQAIEDLKDELRRAGGEPGWAN